MKSTDYHPKVVVKLWDETRLNKDEFCSENKQKEEC